MSSRKVGFATLSIVWNNLFSVVISRWEMECKHSGYDNISCKEWVSIWVYVGRMSSFERINFFLLPWEFILMLENTASFKYHFILWKHGFKSHLFHTGS